MKETTSGGDRRERHSRSCHDPYLRCAFYGAAQTVAGVRQACVLAHSPQGCELLVGTAFAWQQADYLETKSLCTKLCENEIVHGGERTLARTIEEARTFNSPVVFVLTACGPEIVGDDIKAVCESLSPRVPFHLVPVECAGFRGSQYDGVDIALEALLTTASGRPGPDRSPGSVVLLAPHGGGNPTWPGDVAWIREVVERLGLHVACVLTHRTPFGDIAKAGAAEWSLLLSHDCGYEASDRLHRDHGVKPLLPDHALPIGFAGTTRWLESLGRVLGREKAAAEIIAEGENLVVAQCRRRGLEMQFFNHARAAVIAAATLAVPLALAAAEDLEMDPVVVGLRSGHPRAVNLLRTRCEALGISPRIVPSLDVHQASRCLAEDAPDAVLGSNIERHLGADAGVKFVFRVCDPVSRFRLTDRAYFGYTGFLNLLEIIQNDWWDAFRSKERRWKRHW